MAELHNYLLLTALCFGCASGAPSAAQPQVSAVARAPQVPAPCGAPGRAACGVQPKPDAKLPDRYALACVETCSKHWMEGASVVTATTLPLETKRKELDKVQSTWLRCLGTCDAQRTMVADLAMPPSVEPCTNSTPPPPGTACLQYSCRLYGDQKLMLPSGVYAGSRCEEEGSKEPRVCFAGRCIAPADSPAECGAYAVRVAALQWAKVMEWYPKKCADRESDPACSHSRIASIDRGYLLELLNCDFRSERPVEAPTLPWGDWPVALPGLRSKAAR